MDEDPVTRNTPGDGLGVGEVVARIDRFLTDRGPPVVVAVDGRSGSGKSTVAAMIRGSVPSRVVPVDDFFAFEIPDSEWDARTPEERARDALDWRRLRDEALVPLREGRVARWKTYDFEGGRLADGAYAEASGERTCDPAPVIILDGAYSARAELAELVEFTVLVEAPPSVRRRRLQAREDPDQLEEWHARWDAAEELYFGRIRPPGSFDVVVSNADSEDTEGR